MYLAPVLLSEVHIQIVESRYLPQEAVGVVAARITGHYAKAAGGVKFGLGWCGGKFQCQLVVVDGKWDFPVPLHHPEQSLQVDRSKSAEEANESGPVYP